MSKKKTKKDWIKSAIKHPGALTRKAKAAGMTPTQYCQQPNLSPQSQRQCRLMKTLKRF